MTRSGKSLIFLLISVLFIASIINYDKIIYFFDNYTSIKYYLTDNNMSYFILFCLLATYFAPTLYAIKRGVYLWPVIFLINIACGWTIIGWVFSVIFAASWKAAWADSP